MKDISDAELKEIVEEVTRGGQQPAFAIVPPGIAGYESADGFEVGDDFARFGQRAVKRRITHRKIKVFIFFNNAFKYIGIVILMSYFYPFIKTFG